MQRSEREIVEALKSGESWALDAFYRRYASQVLSWAIRLGGPHTDPEDIAQDVFSVALRKISGFRGDSQVSTWLYAITRNIVSNARRKAMLRRMVGLDTVPELPNAGEGPEDEVRQLRRRRMVQDALEGLSAKPREVLVLMDLEGRTAPEVAEMIGVPAGTVYSRLHYARKAFAKELERQGIRREDLFGQVEVSGGQA